MDKVELQIQVKIGFYPCCTEATLVSDRKVVINNPLGLHTLFRFITRLTILFTCQLVRKQRNADRPTAKQVELASQIAVSVLRWLRRLPQRTDWLIPVAVAFTCHGILLLSSRSKLDRLHIR